MLAINKIDLVGFDADVFERIVADYSDLRARPRLRLGDADADLGALSATTSSRRSDNTPWYAGPTLLEHLETVDVDGARPSGRSGSRCSMSTGRTSISAASPARSRRARRRRRRGRRRQVRPEVARAPHRHAPAAICRAPIEGQAVTLLLEDEVEVSRGNMLAGARCARPDVADQFAANVVWFDEQALLPGRSYIVRTATDQSSATVTELKHRLDINSLAHQPAKSLAMNEVGEVKIALQAPIAFDSFAANRATGAFILIDRMTNATAGAGMILHPLRRADNIHWQSLDVTKKARAAAKNQTAGGAVAHRPFRLGQIDHRQFAREEAARSRPPHLYSRRRQCAPRAEPRPRLHRCRPRREHPPRRRSGEADGRCRADRDRLLHLAVPRRAATWRASLFEEGEFAEVFVDTPIEECARRDPKGLYARALAGEIKQFHRHRLAL